MMYRSRIRRLAAAWFAVALLGFAPGLVHAASQDTDVDATGESTLALDQVEPSDMVAADPGVESASLDEDDDTVAFGKSTNGSATIGMDDDGQMLAFGNRTKGTATIGFDEDGLLLAFGKSTNGTANIG
jgi:hypothetical protein